MDKKFPSDAKVIEEKRAQLDAKEFGKEKSDARMKLFQVKETLSKHNGRVISIDLYQATQELKSKHLLLEMKKIKPVNVEQEEEMKQAPYATNRGRNNRSNDVVYKVHPKASILHQRMELQKALFALRAEYCEAKVVLQSIMIELKEKLGKFVVL